MRGKCESCEFFEITYIGAEDGSCRIRSVENWPMRLTDSWCGEHRERETDEDARQRDEMRRATNSQRPAQHRESFG
jgi:hypothetical protein